MFWMVIANILGVFLFLFLIWRGLKDDYQYEKIFDLGFFGIVFFLLSQLLFIFINSTFWFWITLFLMSFGMFLASRKHRLKFYEVIESVSVALLAWNAIYFLEDSIKKSSIYSFLSFWIVLICIFIYFLLKSYYRSFSWYKSGRLGFSGVVSGLLYFLCRFITSFFLIEIVTFAGDYEKYISGSATLLAGLLLYNLIRLNEK